jgi:hypothetical protein
LGDHGVSKPTKCFALRAKEHHGGESFVPCDYLAEWIVNGEPACSECIATYLYDDRVSIITPIEPSAITATPAVFEFDAAGVLALTRDDAQSHLTEKRVDLNAENQGSLAVKITNPGERETGYVMVIQKWEKDWPEPGAAEAEPEGTTA